MQKKWVYSWNPRDQMRYATKYNAADTFAGRVEYKYCLSCDGALSERLEYNTAGTLASQRRHEYDGLNLLRVGQRVDTDGDGVIEAGETAWRHVEVNSHHPGALSPSPPALSHHGEREPVCASGQSTTPSSTTDYVYVYDAVGNLYLVLNDEGGEEYAFSQDAWGIRPGCPSPRSHGHR